jgi:hypothetical protein
MIEELDADEFDRQALAELQTLLAGNEHASAIR